jgi:NAD(P)-dependent dehydrogenase (short-subunit alcohol dehydrogenase family)
MAQRFGIEGYRVYLSDIQTELGEQACLQLRRQGADCRFVRADVCSKSDLSQLILKAVEESGSLDVMINNAGLAIIGPSEDVTEEEWDLSINVMQKGVFFGCQEAAKSMKKQGKGIIINVSSINAEVSFPFRLSYCAAKAAVSSMTRVLALEWAPYGIRVNAVAPGVTRTQMVAKAIEEKHIDDMAYLNRIPMRRFGEPDEIANAVYFLCSEQASYINGEVLTVDGGWSVNGFI